MINNTQVRNMAATVSNSPYNRLNMNSLFENRDVQRAGWLNYIPFAGTNLPSDDHKFWVVFAVYGNQTPFLEFYQQRQPNQTNQIQNDGPVSKHSLLNCRHITAVIEESLHHHQPQEERYFEFSITLDTHVIRLAANNDEVMWDWISCLKTKLISMNILKPSENLYSKSPESSLARRSNLHFLAAFSSNNANNHNQNDNNNQNNTNNQNNVNTQLPLQPPPDSDDLYEPIFNLAESVQRISLAQTMPEEEGPPPYERIFSINNNNNPVDAPRPSFREAQVEKFKKEMEQLNGLTLKVRKKDCYNAIAFVDIHTFGIFVAGWKQKDHPYLHNTFHIGDQLVSINGTVIESAAHAKQFIKQASPYLDIVIRRVPFGQIFCLKKSTDGEELGLIRTKGTAEINFIVPGSVASRAGMPTKCTFFNDNGYEMIQAAALLSNSSQQQQLQQPLEQNWFITEINNRPMNLFLKNDEIAVRLNAIGKEISILVQPVDFIKRLKKQFKILKNYKEFIVQ